MEGFRDFWADMVHTIFDTIAQAWWALVRGVLYEWDLSYFLLGVGVVVILWAVLLWKRRA